MLMADNPGGIPAASGAELEPVPAVVAKCARLGTAYGPDEVIGSSIGIVGSGEDADRFPFDMESSWRGPISVGGEVCKGTVSYGGSLELRDGKLTQKVPKSAIRIRIPAGTSKEQAGKKTRHGVIDTSRLCEIEGQDGTIKLVERETRSYKVEGYPTLYVTNTKPLGKFACNSTEPSTGGVGPDMGDGTGGVSVR